MNQQVNDIAKTWLDRLPLDSRAMVNDTGAAGDSAAIGVGFVNAGVSVSRAHDAPSVLHQSLPYRH